MRKVMIVDDVLFVRLTLSTIFTRAGFEVCAQVENAREAVTQYRALRPDLVTMDIVMPDPENFDGIQAIKEIIAFDPAAKILLVSVMGRQTLVMDAIRAGAVDFVAKPVHPERLLEAVHKILA